MEYVQIKVYCTYVFPKLGLYHNHSPIFIEMDSFYRFHNNN